MNALVLGAIGYAAVAALTALVAFLAFVKGKRFSTPVLARYTPIVYEGPTEPRDPALSAELQALGFRPSLSYRGENMPSVPVFQTWLDEAGTTECLVLSMVLGAYETRVVCFWSLAADRSTRSTFGEMSLLVFDEMPGQRIGIVRGPDHLGRLLAAHHAAVARDGLPLESIAAEDLEQRAVRSRDYFEFQRSRGLLQLDAANAKYVATARVPLRSLRIQLFPVAGDLRPAPLAVALLVAGIVPAALLFFPRTSLWLLLLDLIALGLAGLVAAWMFTPRFLPWTLLIAAVPLYFAPARDLWVFPAAPFAVAIFTYLRRLRKKRVLVNLTPKTNKRRKALLLWIVLVVLFFVFFAYFRRPPR